MAQIQNLILFFSSLNMFFILSKLLNVLITPIFWIVLLALLGLILSKQKYKIRLFTASAIMLLFFTNPFIADEAIRLWTIKASPYEKLERNYDYGIVLTGMCSYDPQYKRINFLKSSDRLWQTMDLYNRGYLDKIFIVGGSGYVRNPDFTEAAYLKDYLMRNGIPKKDIIAETKSRNTYENTVNAAAYLHENCNSDCTYLLISSGYHLRRANACFEKQHIQATCFATDRYVGDRKWQIEHLIRPRVSALGRWNILLHEISGYVMYKIMGYC